MTPDASGLPITQLGATIQAHIGNAEKYIGKTEEHYKAAGLGILKVSVSTGIATSTQSFSSGDVTS